MYREAAGRRPALAGGHDFEQMMTSLHTSADFRRARKSDLDRLPELIQRTSQFNTTTKRRTRSEVSALLQSSRHGVYIASFKDRFGDLGLVAAVIVERAEDQVVVFDSVIMSCRAIGFCLEQLLVRRTLEAEPARAYRGLITPTERNAPSAGLSGTWASPRPHPAYGSWNRALRCLMSRSGSSTEAPRRPGGAR
jgi:FkbH-like protein